MTLDPYWTIVDPLADCTVDQAAGQLFFTIPSGTAHGLSTANKNAPRILRNCSDTDFQIDAKVDSVENDNLEGAGIIVQTDSNNFVSVGVRYDGGFRLYASSFSAGTETVQVNNVIASFTPTWIRLTRVGTSWSFYSSSDGSTYNLEGSFSVSLAIAQEGLFAQTDGGNPAFTALFDFFSADNVDPYVIDDIIDEITFEDQFEAYVSLDALFDDTITFTDVFSATAIAPPATGSVKYVFVEWRTG